MESCPWAGRGGLTGAGETHRAETRGCVGTVCQTHPGAGRGGENSSVILLKAHF